ncbi:hypothetical protein TRVL_01372 [Trypanosoma vivax]|nr:hypothetical protein TRVL_01372 [Trypanosoma vivax]
MGGPQRRSGKSHYAISKWFLQCSGFLVSGAFCVVLLAILLAGPDKRDAGNNALANSTLFLLKAIKTATNSSTTDAFTSMGLATLRVGALLEAVIVESEKREALLIEMETVQAVETYNTSVQILLNYLALRPEGWWRSGENSEIVENMWFLTAVTCHALVSVLPEYFLAVDNTGAHAESLVRGLGFLTKASNGAFGVISAVNKTVPSPKAVTWPRNLSHFRERNASNLVDCARAGDYGSWQNFCKSTFSHVSRLEVRRAAVLEELIVLYPEYAPLRLHYAIVLTLSREAAKKAVAIDFIAKEQMKLHTRSHVDALHGPMLLLCKTFLLAGGPFVESASADNTSRIDLWFEVLDALRKVGDCETLQRPFNDTEQSSIWRRHFRGVERPNAMDAWQVARFFDGLRELKRQIASSNLDHSSLSYPLGFNGCSGEGLA